MHAGAGRDRRVTFTRLTLFTLVPPRPPGACVCRQLASTLTERLVESGGLLITKGGVGEEMFFIISGGAHVLSSLDDAVPMATLGPNDFCGEEALLLEAPRNAYVRAGGDEVLSTLALSKKDLLKVLESYPALADVILAPIAQQGQSPAPFDAVFEQ